MIKRALLTFLLSSAAVLCAGVRTGDMIVSDGNRVVMRGERMSLDDMLARRKQLGQRFFYFESEGRRYVVRDSATVTKILAMYETGRPGKREEKELHRQQRELDRREQALDREIDRLEDQLDEDDDDVKDRPALESRRRTLEKQARELANESRRLEEIENRIEAENDAFEARVDRDVERMIPELIRSGAAERIR